MQLWSIRKWLCRLLAPWGRDHDLLLYIPAPHNLSWYLVNPDCVFLSEDSCLLVYLQIEEILFESCVFAVRIFSEDWVTFNQIIRKRGMHCCIWKSHCLYSHFASLCLVQLSSYLCILSYIYNAASSWRFTTVLSRHTKFYSEHFWSCL